MLGLGFEFCVFIFLGEVESEKKYIVRVELGMG